MRLVTYRSNVSAAARLGAIVSDRVVDLERLGAARGAALPSTMQDFIELGPDAVATATELLGNAWTVSRPIRLLLRREPV